MNPKSFVAIATRPFLFCIALWCLLAGGVASALAAEVEFTAVVAPSGYVDIRIGYPGWSIISNPTPSTATIARVGADTSTVDQWGGANFNSSTSTTRLVAEGQFLRVYAGTTPAGQSIRFTASAFGQFDIQVTVQEPAAKLISLKRLAPASTSRGLVQWEAVYNNPVTGITADNFVITNNALLFPAPTFASVEPVSGSGNKKYTIAVQIAGYGLGTLGLRSVGHATESPTVPTTLVGDFYDVDTLSFGIEPGGEVNLPASGLLYILSGPSPSGATMARYDSALTSGIEWNTPQFQLDPGNNTNNRVFGPEYLRIRTGTVTSGTITVNYSRSTVGGSLPIRVTVATPPARPVSMNIIDPSPTTASTVRWEVTFDKAVTGVSTDNFGFINSANITPAPVVASVAPSPGGNNVKWIVTASTPGTGTGVLSLRWVGHISESPSVPYAYIGLAYQFSDYPVIVQDIVTTPYFVAPGAPMPTLSPQFLTRGTSPLQYRWKRGTSQNPTAATDLGVSTAFYTPPVTTTQGAYNYFCRAFVGLYETGYYTDSSTATVNVVAPPAITAQPAANSYISLNSAASLSVQATGYSPQYQWYKGASGDKSNLIAGATSATYSPSPTVATTYWVLVSNVLGSAYDVASNTATVNVIKQLTATTTTTVTPTILDNVSGLTVRADDPSNNPVSGVPVVFTISSSGVVGGATAGGSFSGLTYVGGTLTATVNTGSDGTAAAPSFWTNTKAGSYNVTAALGTLSRAFTITNQPLPFSSFTKITGTPPTATAGVVFSSQPKLQMIDAWSNSIPSNAAVTAGVDANKIVTGTLQGTTTVNAVNGLVTFTDLKYLVAEKIAVQIQSGTVNFNLGDMQVSAAAPQKMAVYSGSPQVALPGATFSLPLIALLTDAYGNPIEKTSLTFTAPTSGASATFVNNVNKIDTDDKGRAKLGVIANNVNGTYAVTATMTNGSIASFASFTLSNLSTVEAWRSDNFNGNWNNTGNAADTAMPFGDGVPNLAKFAFNLNARGPDRTQMVPTGFNGLPYTGMDSSKHLTMTFVRRKSSTTPGITYTPQFSNSPAGSSFAANASATTSALTIDNTWERVTVTDSVTMGAGQPVRYGRVLISNP